MTEVVCYHVLFALCYHTVGETLKTFRVDHLHIIMQFTEHGNAIITLSGIVNGLLDDYIDMHSERSLSLSMQFE